MYVQITVEMHTHPQWHDQWFSHKLEKEFLEDPFLYSIAYKDYNMESAVTDH